jgi:hypothetical protein
MKLFIFALLLLTSSLSAGLAPRKMHNEHKSAYAHKVEIQDVEAETRHIAHYAEGTVITVLSGPAHGLQWIVDSDGEVTAYADNVKWHDHSFTHHYPGAKVHSYTTSKGQHGQTITYYKH